MTYIVGMKTAIEFFNSEKSKMSRIGSVGHECYQQDRTVAFVVDETEETNEDIGKFGVYGGVTFFLYGDFDSQVAAEAFAKEMGWDYLNNCPLVESLKKA